MTALTLVGRNLSRSPVRTALTVLSTGLSLFLLRFVLTVVDALERTAKATEGHPRIIVHHRTSFAVPIPEGYLEKIRRVPGVLEIAGQSYYGGLGPDETYLFASLATDPVAWPRVFPDFAPSPAECKAFAAERRGCLIGPALAQRFGWTRGQHITLRGTIYPVNLDFIICGITSWSIPNPALFLFQSRYFEETIGHRGLNLCWVRVPSVADIPRVSEAIDRQFANSPAETISESERSLFSTFVGTQDHLVAMIRLVGLMVVLITLSVAGNTMAMAVRERTGELAVMRCLGFRAPWIMRLVVLESVSIALAGGLAGTAAAWGYCATHGLALGFGPMAHFLVQWPQVVLGLLAAAVIGLLAGAIPAAMASRLSAAQALRRVG